MNSRFLHNHPRLEKNHGLEPDHVIVDRPDWVLIQDKLRDDPEFQELLFPGNRFKGIFNQHGDSKKPILITKGRGEGKTTKLIELADNYNGYIVCHSQEECARVASEAREMERNIHFPITYEEFLKGQFGSGVTHVLIDNIDMLLQQLINPKVPILAMTITK